MEDGIGFKNEFFPKENEKEQHCDTHSHHHFHHSHLFTRLNSMQDVCHMNLV